VVAVVKEEELPPPVEAEKMRGLTDFQEQYFCGPLYLSDEPRTLYEFLGNKPIFTWRTLGKARACRAARHPIGGAPPHDRGPLMPARSLVRVARPLHSAQPAEGACCARRHAVRDAH
jgi:hypothetical protein